MTKLIERNTTIPTRKSETFSTAADGQSDVHVKVYQGEREIAAANKMLGDFQLSGIPPAPRGTPQIEVTFNIDANGILSVSAKEKLSGKEQSITVTGSSNLNKNDIERMVAEAQANADEDRRQRDKAEMRNKADQAVYQAERTVKDLGDKVTAEDKASIETKVADVRSAVESDDTSRLETALNALQQTTYDLTSRLYQQAAASETEGGTAGPAPDEKTQVYNNGADDTAGAKPKDKDDVIDADFKTEA
ncbi:MAG: Hsp70 family protein, partial [Cytophagales bacterium]|nr:Hsp70 family protein [Armatimonadota bacterium]